MPRPGKIYLALDTNYFDDADIVELSDAAQLHDLRAMCLAKRAGTDGRLSRRQLERIAPDSGGESLGEIVEGDIWFETEPGAFVRRNWLAWNDSAADIETMSRGGKHGNHVKWHVKGKKTPSPKCEFCVSEGLVSPPDRQATRQATSPPTPYIDVDVDVDTYTNAFRPDRDKLDEFFRFGEALAHKSEATFTTLLMEKTDHPDELAAAWDGRNKAEASGSTTIEASASTT